MRTAHDWGQATGRPRTSATVSRKSIYFGALACTAAAALAACDNSAKSATNPTDPTVATGAVTGTMQDESTLIMYHGVAYPQVNVKPSANVDMKVGEQSTFTARLNEPTGDAWTSCCSTWKSSDASVASVSVTGYGVHDGERGVVVGHKSGKATITVKTQSGTSGALDVTVGDGSSGTGSGGSSSGGSGGSGGGSGSPSKSPAPSKSPTAPPPSGSYHEPSGFATQINTGSIRSTGAVAVLSPSTTTSVGESSENLSVVPGGSGLRLTYRPNLQAGNSPVRFGLSMPSAGTGWYYQRMKIRFSSNWTDADNPAVKLCEPRTWEHGNGQGPTENDVISAFMNGDPTKNYLTVLLQGPNGHFSDLFPQPAGNPRANLSDGNWHVMEVLFGPESSPGAGNGTYQAWVDGVQVASRGGVNWLAAGNRPGWSYLLFDPTYGGAKSSPPTTMYWDVDDIFVATR